MKPVDVTFADYQSMVEMFQQESDRGAAVLAGSYVENHLGLYLRSRMIDQSATERMFSSEGGLSTFSHRIDLAQAFGFLSKRQCEDLNLIKKIRNHFAHHPKEASFSKTPISDWVHNLVASQTKLTLPDGTTDVIADERFCYLVSAGMFLAQTMECK